MITRNKPLARPEHHLPITVDEATALCRQALEAFDQGKPLNAVQPVRELRQAGIGLRINLPPETTAPTLRQPVPLRRRQHDDFDPLFERKGCYDGDGNDRN